jgi:Zn-dependent peptidase ImmA (M78 family)/DNA-binding XRE family transcriptional regulator
MAITREELGRRIRSAREGCGLTQEQLGELTGLSRLAVGQVEVGNRSVSSIELDLIAHVLARDIKSFLSETFAEHDPLAALFRSDAALAEQSELRHALQDSLALGREMTNLERLLGIDRAQLRTASYELPGAKSKWDAIQQGQRVASDERQRLGLALAPVGDLVEILESQGVRTGMVSLPDNISGLTLWDSKIGIFVVINRRHSALRRRFSFAHEYAHVVLDRDRAGAISRAEDRADLLEVRANAFAAEFMMPAEGVRQFIQALGKGAASRSQMAVFDGTEVVQIEQRPAPGTQDIQLHDVVLLAHHFGVSRIFALYRLRNLRLIDEREIARLKEQEDSGAAKAMAEFLAADIEINERDSRDEFRRRFLGLALEAVRREEITASKFSELAGMLGLQRQVVSRAFESAGIV